MDPFGLVGTTVADRYRVEALVGEGGFAVVYRATHAALGQTVALKCLKVPPHFTPGARQAFLAKFEDEGRILSKLGGHPSIVGVRDLGVCRDGAGQEVPFLALEWLDGCSLEDLLLRWRSEGRPPLDERAAVALVEPALEGLAFAHSHGIAHRDVKPGNLFATRTVTGANTLKVVDFGIAKAMQDGETASQSTSRTSSGFTSFSLQYGAPEQLRPGLHGPSGPWSDVHAMGLVLTELVTGRSAYEGDEPHHLFEATQSPHRPTPRKRGARVSDAFEHVCARALALRPADRPPHAGALLAELRALSSVPAMVPSMAFHPTTAAPLGATPPPGAMPAPAQGHTVAAAPGWVPAPVNASFPPALPAPPAPHLRASLAWVWMAALVAASVVAFVALLAWSAWDASKPSHAGGAGRRAKEQGQADTQTDGAGGDQPPPEPEAGNNRPAPTDPPAGGPQPEPHPDGPPPAD
jgi:serine/threonine protein kinase